MPESWEEARAKCQAALGQLVEGNAEASKSLWSRSDDIVIMGAFGGVEHGWERVAERLDWASAGIRASGRRVENLFTVVGEDLACTTEDRYSVGQLGAEEAARRLVALAPGFKYLPERWP